MSSASGLQLLWLAGFATLAVLLWRAASRMRQLFGDEAPDETVSDWHGLGLLLLVAALGLGAIHVWGIAIVTHGHQRMVDDSRSPSRNSDARDVSEPLVPRSTARARVILREVQVFFDTPALDEREIDKRTDARKPLGSIEIGYHEQSAIRLPTSYGLAESHRGENLFAITGKDKRKLDIRSLVREDSDTRVLVWAHPRSRDVQANPASDLHAADDALLTGRGRCRATAPSPTIAASYAYAYIVFLCRGDRPIAALVFTRTLAETHATGARVPVRVRPYVRRDRRWRQHSARLQRGSLLQIGALDDALPGMTVWEVPAPRGNPGFLFPPENLLAPCSTWNRGDDLQSGFQVSPTGRMLPADSTLDDDSFVCVLPVHPPFALEVRRLLPSVHTVRTRAIWAGILLMLPALLLMSALAWQRREHHDRRLYLTRIGGFALVSIALTALSIWRLVWAHRIDMMREYEVVGTRVLQTEWLIVCAGAALSATGALILCRLRATPRWRALAIGLCGWLAGLTLGWYALRYQLSPDGASRSGGSRNAAQVAMSLILGLGSLYWPHARTRLTAAYRQGLSIINGGIARLRSRTPLTSRSLDIDATWPIAFTCVFTALVLACLLLDIRRPLVKLVCAWSYPIIAYHALRACIRRHHDSSWVQVIVTAIALSAAFITLAALDAGVTIAIAGTGLVIAIIAVAHDHVHDDRDYRDVDDDRSSTSRDAASESTGDYTRYHKFSLFAACAIGALALTIVAYSAVGMYAGYRGDAGDPSYPRALTSYALYALLVPAILFAGAAFHVRKRYALGKPSNHRSVRRALPWAAWIGLAVVLVGMWAARTPAMHIVMSAGKTMSTRLAAIVDPAYAFLEDDRGFAKHVTAWRETSLRTAIADSADQDAPSGPRFAAALDHGQGFFGADIRDYGVLLSIENDYFPILLVRETGGLGMSVQILWLLLLALSLWIGGARFAHGTSSRRVCQIVGVTFGLVAVYQPLAALGALPLTGISCPGLGIDSPADFWIVFALLALTWVWTSHTTIEDYSERHLAREHELFAEHAAPLVRTSLRVQSAVIIVLIIAGATLVFRTAAFALQRHEPVQQVTTPSGESSTQLRAPFKALEHALSYANQFTCERDHWPFDDDALTTGAVDEVLPEPASEPSVDASVERFDAAFKRVWNREAPFAMEHLQQCLRGDAVAGDARAFGHWRTRTTGTDDRACHALLSRDDAVTGTCCSMQFSYGFANLYATYARARTGYAASCRIADPSPAAIRALEHTPRKPYADARIRVVSRAMGDAARDVGELISGSIVIRLRPGAGSLDITGVQAGQFTAERVDLGDGLEIAIDARSRTTATIRHAPARQADEPMTPKLLTRDRASRASPHRAHGLPPSPPSPWSQHALGPERHSLSDMAIIISGARGKRSSAATPTRYAWLYRPRDGDHVDPLLADDVVNYGGRRKRHYVYGGFLPELGWTNPFAAHKSLGLEGWLREAASRYERDTRRLSSAYDEFMTEYCPHLDDPTPASLTEHERRFSHVCRESGLDDVLECRVSVQPELQMTMRHLLELASQRPQQVAPSSKRQTPWRAALTSSFALIRADTSEIVAHAHYVPGRESSAYAPHTDKLERYLIAALEDRDPRTWAKQPGQGAIGAEKLGWTEPVPVASTLKPLVGRAVEHTDNSYSRALRLSFKPRANNCANGTRRAFLGHCPPSNSLWLSHTRPMNMRGFIGYSLNWYQAGLGFLGPALGGGTVRIGDGTPKVMGTRPEGIQGASWNLAAYDLDQPISIASNGRTVIAGRRRFLDLDALRSTPMWRAFEAVVGRPLCSADTHDQCRRRWLYRDVCAARALPIDRPSRRLRSLVSLGSGALDMSFIGARDDRPERLPPSGQELSEYFQFLRGSGKYRFGSALQLADAYTRLLYEPAPISPTDDTADIRYRGAASWFPLPARSPTNELPTPCSSTSSAESTVQSGLCMTLTEGTARRLFTRYARDRDIVFYGAKTGTMDSLDDIAENPRACRRYNQNRTLSGATEQPFQLACDTKNAANDSLLVIGFGVRDGDSDAFIPMTLALFFQRSGDGFAVHIANEFIELVRSYFTH